MLYLAGKTYVSEETKECLISKIAFPNTISRRQEVIFIFNLFSAYVYLSGHMLYKIDTPATKKFYVKLEYMKVIFSNDKFHVVY